MSARKFTNAFASPVAWTDENGAAILSVSWDGYDFSAGDPALDGCRFKLSLEDDRRSVVVSVDPATDSHLVDNQVDFNEWAETAVAVLVDEPPESVNVLDVATGRPYLSAQSGKTPAVPASDSIAVAQPFRPF